MHRFYFNPSTRDGEVVRIAPEESAHMKVLRLEAGSEIELLDGEGGRFRAKLIKADSSGAQAEILEALSPNEPRLLVTLYQGMPKSDKLELIVQKSTELGVFAVEPVFFLHSDVKQLKKPERLVKISREAAKQCGRGWVPRIGGGLTFQQALQRAGAHDLLLVPWENGGISLTQAINGHDLHSVGLVIGPEGGISAAEMNALESLGAVPITLGPRILRTETASLATISAIMCLAGEWGD